MKYFIHKETEKEYMHIIRMNDSGKYDMIWIDDVGVEREWRTIDKEECEDIQNKPKEYKEITYDEMILELI